MGDNKTAMELLQLALRLRIASLGDDDPLVAGVQLPPRYHTARLCPHPQHVVRLGQVW